MKNFLRSVFAPNADRASASSSSGMLVYELRSQSMCISKLIARSS